MGSLASISGVALVPGVSRNKRLYTPEIIAKAAARMQERLKDPNGLPIVMRTHHEAGDDSAKIVGRVTAVEVDNDKALRYKADLYNTFHGQEIAGLVTPKQPALRSVSIHGYWMGDTKQVQTESGMATTADDLEIDAIDFTASPGVDGALIDSSSRKATESGGVLRTPISEAMEASVTLIEEGSGWADITQEAEELYMVTEGAQHGNSGLTVLKTSRGVQYEGDLKEYWVAEAKYSADDMKDLLAKGHAMKNASGEPSYPIKDVSDLKKAIKAVGRGGKDHDAIRRHIIKRAKALGQAALIPDNWGSDGSMKESHGLRMSEVREYYPDGDMGSASFCIDAYYGPLSVTVRGCVPPEQLRGAAQAATMAAMDAIQALDPDMDLDIDAGAESREQGTGAVGGVLPDDSMIDLYGESAKKEGDMATEADLSKILQTLAEMRERMEGFTVEKWRAELGEAAAVNGVKGKPDVEAKAVNGVQGEPDSEAAAVNGVEGEPGDENMMGGHSHTHDMGEGTTHTHGHVHTHETAGGGSYDHTHGHTHFHLPGGDETHMHTHAHDHSTASSDTHESHTHEESAMSETNKAAEAAPTRTLTDEDIRLLGETFAAALHATDDNKNAKHAAPAQETAEVTQEVAAESKTKADDLVALKESLAKELRKELRDELRNEFLKENGLPPRRGYRLSENAEEEVQLSDADLFNKHRVDILLGAYAQTPSPDAPAAG